MQRVETSSYSPAPPLSATVIVARELSGDVEVLLLRRHSHMRAFGGYWVFPGGALDDTDASLEAAACRELREEAGLAVDPTSLCRWAHWITPSVQKARFDTTFFLVPAPNNQRIVLATEESSDARWVSPSACDLHTHATDLPLMPPTIFVLRELVEAVQQRGSLAAAIDAARAQSIQTVVPKIIAAEEGPTVVFPWDSGYPELPGEGVPWDQEAATARAHWPSRILARPQRV